jgi:hypothetical protein
LIATARIGRALLLGADRAAIALVLIGAMQPMFVVMQRTGSETGDVYE